MRTPSSSRNNLPAALVLAAVAAALGCSKPSATPPTGFGVNITVDASKLSAAQRSMVKIGSLLVSAPNRCPSSSPSSRRSRADSSPSSTSPP